jgi:hypothetical protein
LLHDALLAVRIAAGRILLAGNAEQNHAAQAESFRLATLLGDEIDRELRLPRHRTDRLADAFARPGE